MLRDVLDALCRSQTIDAVAVVSGDPDVRQLSESRGLLVIDEASVASLNADVTHAVEILQGMDAKRITVIHADLPLVTALEIDRVCGAHKNPAATETSPTTVIIPAADHQGTNVLSFDARHPIPFRYGPNSFNLHCEALFGKHRPDLRSPNPKHYPLISMSPQTSSNCLHIAVGTQSISPAPAGMFLKRAGMTNASTSSTLPAGGLVVKKIVAIAAQSNLESLCETAAQLRDTGHGDLCTYSPKVFLPITRLCRDFCHYCTFATVAQASQTRLI